MCFKKVFNSISIKWLIFLVGHLRLPTIGLNVRSLCSKMLMISLFGVLTANSIIIYLWILSSPKKLLTLWCLSFRNFHSGSAKHILWCLRNLKRLLCILFSMLVFCMCFHPIDFALSYFGNDLLKELLQLPLYLHV